MSAPVRKVVTVDDEFQARRCAQGRVLVIDDDPEILQALQALLDLEGYASDCFASATEYLQAVHANAPQFPGPVCLLCDVKMPDINGLELQQTLRTVDDIPLLLMSGASGAQEAASAFRAGALDFLVKPVDADTLLAALQRALDISTQRQRNQLHMAALKARLDSLTQREREVIRLVARGYTNQAVAESLNIALRTVKLHRQHALEKLGASSTAELVRIADQANL